jgi:hypothetical protein
MARTDWVALRTSSATTSAAASEYQVAAELHRFDLLAYIPQCWRPHLNVAKLYPRWPKIVLTPVKILESKLLPFVGGLDRPDPILQRRDGTPLRIPVAIVRRLALIELRGFLDDKRARRAGADEIDRVIAEWIPRQLQPRPDADSPVPVTGPVDPGRVAAAAASGAARSRGRRGGMKAAENGNNGADLEFSPESAEKPDTLAELRAAAEQNHRLIAMRQTEAARALEARLLGEDA